MSSLLTTGNSLSSANDEKRYKAQHCDFGKEILIEGSGFSKPLLGSQCEVGYVESCDYESAVTIEELDVKKHVTIGMSQDVRSIGLETMLMTMKRGETCRFHVLWNSSSPSLSCSYSETSKSIVDSSGVKQQYFILVLHNFTDETPIWQLDSEQKYDLSLQHKDNGTLLFKDDKFESAFYQYSLATKYIISVTSTADLDDSLKEKCKKLKSICHLNLAACQLKSENFESVIENCSKVLVLDPWNAKGLYRRAVAYKHMGQLNEARSDLIKIVKKEPRNKPAGDLLESMMPSNADDDCKEQS